LKYITQVWTPSGGWWANPKHWKRNTGVAFGVIGLLGGHFYRFGQQGTLPAAAAVENSVPIVAQVRH
jgi:hypothetical protein